jgi:transposase
VTLTAGQRHDSTQLAAVLDRVLVPRRGGGAARKRPDLLLGDKGYSYPRCRRELRRRGIRQLIPERADQQAQRQKKGRRGGRPVAFDAQTYRRRNVVERAIGRLKQFRRIATRYEKRALNYVAFLHLAAIVLWLA